MAKPRFNIAGSDSEALETLRQWWHEYGKFAGIGLLLAAGGVGGWQGWDYYRHNHAVEAADLYIEFVKQLEAGAAADDAIPELPSDSYADTAYLPFAYFQRAQYFVEHEKLAEAAEDLRWVAENSLQPILSKLAYVRLARVMISLGETEEALFTLDDVLFPNAFIPLVEETRGDALLKIGDVGSAITAYRTAWGASRLKPEFLRWKLESLGQQMSVSAEPSQ